MNNNDVDISSEILPSKTFRVVVGCGNRYITITNRDNKMYQLRIHRNSKCSCPNTYIDGLARQATFGLRRDIEQVIADLSGGEHHHCDSYGIHVKSAIKQGKMGAFSCSDAVAKVLKSAVSK